jgi:hypothetical protein
MGMCTLYSGFSPAMTLDAVGVHQIGFTEVLSQRKEFFRKNSHIKGKEEP